jgi:superfamily II DNA or RNA helicase
MKQLRYYQKEAHVAINNDYSNNVNSVLLQMATGTGKTFTTTSYIQQNSESIKNVLWLTHKEELIDQSSLSLMLSLCNDDELSEGILELYKQHDDSFVDLMTKSESGDMFSISDRLMPAFDWVKTNMGLIKQKIGQYDRPFVVASIQTAARRLTQLSQRSYDLIVIDEAHLALSKTWMDVCSSVPHKHKLGLTATPERMDGVAMDQLFDKISYVYDLKKAIDDGNLCQIEALRVKTDVNLDKVRTTAGELNSKDLAIVDCPERNNLICDRYFEKAEGKKTLVFASSITHAVNLTRTMRNRGINADIVVSDKEICPDRRGAIKKFTQGKTDVLVNVEILTTGFDYPNIGCIILARPTKSRNLYIQIIGRGTRLKDQKYIDKFGQKVLIMDIVDVTSRHSLINAYSLDYGKRIEDRIFLTDEQRERLLAKREKQDDERMSKIDRVTQNDTRVNLMQLPELKTHDLATMDRQYMSPKQEILLRSLGYPVDDNSYTKADAFQIIGNQEAKSNEVALLKSMGYDVTLGATHYQYIEAQNQKLEEYKKQREQWKLRKKVKK